MDVVLLSRWQFALTIGFHYIFPALTIGLAWLLVILEWFGWRRNDDEYVRGAKFFAKLFAVSFAVGVASGIVMEFQFGTNWAEYSKFVGDIFGAPLAAEGVFAFFLESSFLGLYLFGRNRVSKGVHWFSSLMVAFGATLSAFWIIVANSWQQTPAGYVIRNGRAELTDFWAAVFNDSTLIRYFHTVDSCLIAGSFFMIAVSAYLLLRNKHVGVASKTMKVSVIVGFISSVLAVVPTGHAHAQQVARTQPAKFAAIEGLYTSQSNAPLVLFALPVDDPPDLIATLEIPSMLSWMAFGDPDAHIQGIDEFPEDEIPPLWLTFVSFHNMVVLGMYFIGITALALFLMIRKQLFENRLILNVLMWSVPLPIFAVEFGWVTAEVGRQPWIVYGLLKTADGHSKNVQAGDVLFSIILFSLIYLIMGILWFYLTYHKATKGPEPAGEEVKV
ncbi:cytochrome ubiquinol oxidase subunit I [bacterium]|nr:cytochrome ubiquinol oxidase subunit I [bacterium]